MASITRRKTGWFVQVRRKGFEPEYRTFTSKLDADKWARDRETAIDRGDRMPSYQCLRSQTLGDLIRRYLIEVTPSKRSADSERLRLGKILTAPVCQLSLSQLTPAALGSYRDHRLTLVKPATVQRELNLISSTIEVARLDWGISLPSNPVKLVRRPKVRDARDRRLRAGELAKLEIALADTRNPLVAPAVRLAIETGLRRGELLKLHWHHIDLDARTAHIPDTKTGYARTIPLSDGAVAVFEAFEGRAGPVFPMTPMAFKLAWNRARTRAGMPDLRLHDLRHEAISRFAEMGLTAIELSVISGHRDLRMLFRYTHLRPQDLAAKLAGRSWEAERAENQKRGT